MRFAAGVVDERFNIFHFPRDGVWLRVAALAAAAPIVGVDSKIRRQERSNVFHRSELPVAHRAVYQNERGPVAGDAEADRRSILRSHDVSRTIDRGCGFAVRSNRLVNLSSHLHIPSSTAVRKQYLTRGLGCSLSSLGDHLVDFLISGADFKGPETHTRVLRHQLNGVFHVAGLEYEEAPKLFLGFGV